MKKFFVAAAMLGMAAMAQAQVLNGTFNSGRDEQTENSSSMDIRFGACEYDSSLTCAWAVRSVAADGSTNEGVMLEPSDNFDPNDGQPFEMAGALLLTGLSPDGEGRWAGGLFYNPATGREFDGVYARLTDSGDIDVGGCILIFCQDTTFTKL